MTPEQRIAQLERQVASLSEAFNMLRASSNIPFDIEKALQDRLLRNLQEKVTDITSDFPSPPLAQAVNEGGMGSYDVMTTPEYVLKLKLGSLYVAIPAFDI